MPDSTFIIPADTSAVSDIIVQPADSAFLSGKLHLEKIENSAVSQSSGTGSHYRQESIVLDIITMLFVILGMACLRKYITIFPSLVGCIIRWKENINLEDSTKLCLARNHLYVLLLIPFCLIAAKFRIYDPGIISGMPDLYRFLCITGIFLIYLLIKQGLQKFVRFGKIQEKSFSAAVNSFRTYFVIFVTITLASIGISELADISEDISRNIITYELSVIYIIFLFRKAQIFINSCSLISGILYLCTLEILPTGILVALAIVL